jgi:hypothetical protein
MPRGVTLVNRLTRSDRSAPITPRGIIGVEVRADKLMWVPPRAAGAVELIEVRPLREGSRWR